MKYFFSAFAILALLFACTREDNNNNEQNGEGKDNIIHVTGLSLDYSSATIKEGESITLVATVSPSNADNKAIAWSSSSNAVATVDASGRVTGVKAGSATVTATAEDGGFKATCSLIVEANQAMSVTVGASHVSLNSAVLACKANLGSTVAADLQLGLQYSTSAGILPSNSTSVEATDADENYNYTLTITGLEPDTKYYFRSYVRQNNQYTYGETMSFTTKGVASLLETMDATGIGTTASTLNAKLDLTDVVYGSLEYGFRWGTSESSQDKSQSGGNVVDNVFSASLTNLSPQTQYWYKAYVKLGGQTFYGNVKSFTTGFITVESVSLDKTEYTFHTIGSSVSLIATVLPSDASEKGVEWSSDNPDVASVGWDGKITAKNNGGATITVKTKDQGKTATCKVTVAQWVTTIGITSYTNWLYVGGQVTLYVTNIQPQNAYDKTYTWSSSDNEIASVDDSGTVTAKAKGTVTIMATANDGSGVFDSCTFEVRSAPEAVDMGTVVNGKNIKWASFNIGASSPTDYGGRYAWGESSIKSSYTWSTYIYGKSEDSIYKYGWDGKKVLEKDDDVAFYRLRGKWRMPTRTELWELMHCCTWTWTESYNGTGVKGVIVTASNGNSIFFPARKTDNKVYGKYWTSSVSTGYPHRAWALHIANGSNEIYDFDYERCDGLFVRPVSE